MPRASPRSSPAPTIKGTSIDAMVESILTTLRAAIDNTEISRYGDREADGCYAELPVEADEGGEGNLTIETLAKLAVELGMTVRLEPARKAAREEKTLLLKRKKRQ